MKSSITKLLSIALLLLQAHAIFAQERPNILWLTSEDNGPQLGCYGDKYATTPSIDALAVKGLRYKHAWSNAPVCAPARTTIVTGVYAPSLGAENMRSFVPLPAFIRMFPQYLRDAGYYCTNNSKEDYNIEKPGRVWDESSTKAHWKNRDVGQPFFAVFNYTISHESQIRNVIPDVNSVHDPARVRIPVYHPDTPEARKDWAQYYDRLTMMDTLVGKALKELDDAGLADETIVLYYGDHGSGMPRSKRFPYNSGLQVPMIAYFPPKFAHLAPAEYSTGGTSDRMVAFVDLAPTVLSLVGIKPPEWMQGRAFAGKHETAPAPYLHGFRNRMDERYDLIRSTRDDRYIYIRNYSPHLIYGQHIDYMFRTPTTLQWHDLYHAGKLTPEQRIFWQTKPAEELYDLQNDPDEVNNLAGSHAHQVILQRLRSTQNQWLADIRDTGFLPESELHSRSGDSTPYEMGQDESTYAFSRIKGMADIATNPAADAFEILRVGLSDNDSAVRYWASLGLMIRGKDAVNAALEELSGLLDDGAPAPRLAAAQALATLGPADYLDRSLDVMLAAADIRSNPLFVAMQALNAIDAAGIKAKPRLSEIAGLPTTPKDAPQRVREYTQRMSEAIQANLRK